MSFFPSFFLSQLSSSSDAGNTDVFSMFLKPSLPPFPLHAVLGTGVDQGNVTAEQLLQCGVNFCPAAEEEPEPEPEASTSSPAEEGAENANFSADPTRVYVLMGVFLACSLVAPAMVALLVDPIKR